MLLQGDFFSYYRQTEKTSLCLCITCVSFIIRHFCWFQNTFIFELEDTYKRLTSHLKCIILRHYNIQI